ncbi:MAG: malonate decarboxylase holo-[acyl-carrier-protein] synthase [Lentisphaerae bacterium]|nr:malonate decarboxylase holo-[acyl-carrier-protein] synthase [Lentisphaerota bacterium]MCP4103362.1 malonate decarboxylase holo-[acyl-carrier-protein] synthase [Lentisphaerota bacterium]
MQSLTLKNIKRHQLVYLTPEILRDKSSCVDNIEHIPILEEWFSAGHPAIIRRPCFKNDNVYLGVPLPPSMGKLRIAFTVPNKHIKATVLPPFLKECMCSMPECMQDELSNLLASNLPVRVIGSAAWQALTGLEYMSSSSDVDLLIEVKSKMELDATDKALANWHQDVLHKYDIEIQLTDGSGFLWKEYQQKSKTILVKQNSKAVLLERSSLT